MSNDRICAICDRPIPPSEGLVCADVKLSLVHLEPCGNLVAAHRRDYSHSHRGRLRPEAEVLRLARGAYRRIIPTVTIGSAR